MATKRRTKRKVTRKAKYGRNLKGQIKSGYYLSCYGSMGKAMPKRRPRR